MPQRPQSRWILLAALTAIALYLCWLVLKPFLAVLLWASVLALTFHPAYRWWLRRTGRASLAALITTVLVVLTIIVPLVGLSSAVIAEFQGVASSAQGQVTALIADPEQAARIQWVVDAASEHLGLSEAELRDGLQKAAAAASQFLVQGTVNVLGGALGFLVSTFFVMFTMYYLFKDGERAVEVVRDLLPVDRARGDRLVAHTAEIISASVFGVVVIAVIQGALGGLMFWALGVPSPLIWGVVMIVLATIPMLGTFIVWVPAAIFLALTGHWVKAIVLAVWGAVVIGMADNVLRPRLVGQRAQMHELMIFFAVLGGLQVFGVLGILLGPVVVALAMGLFEAFRDADDEPRVVLAGELAAAAAPVPADGTALPAEDDGRQAPPSA